MGEGIEGWIFTYTDHIDLGWEYIGRGNLRFKNMDSKESNTQYQTNVKSGP